ncbi:protein ELYS isoform 2-T3 [Spinachia spinachia]
MHDLTAQVTSSLLPFPEVTKDALGEDEITLDSVLHGNFTVGRSGLAWLACGPHLEVVHAVTGQRLSAYCFSGGGEHPPCVRAARDFSWLKRSGLLVGLEEAEGSVLCLYDLGLSRVVKAVVIPGRITAIEPLVSYGGASTSTQHLHQSLRWFFGIAAVITDLGHVLLVDLCLDDLSCSQSELESSDLQVVTKSPAEIPRLREASTRQGRHLCLQLNGPSGVGATALQYISRTNQLAVGFSDGNLQLWNMKTLKKEYHSQLDGGRVPVHALNFQEPENDPRNCCYLWAVQSSQDLEGDLVSLRLLQMAFSERKCLTSGKILYEGLEYCEERYSQELSGTAFPLRAHATNTRLLSCRTIEKFRPHPDRDDSMNEVASPDTSVSIFCWQVKAYGQGTPSTYIGVFDINRWYHAQMPDSLRTGESLQNCPYLGVWSLDPVVQMVSQHVLLDVVVHDRSLSRGLPFTCPPPEQYFNPTTYNFDATCLLNSGIVHFTCSGFQKETLGFLKKAAPCSSDIISTGYSRCLMSGLLSSRLADTQASSLSQEEQLDAILSTAVETSSLGMITGCIKQWTAQEQPGSALNLRYILDWAWNKVVQTKEELDGICAPLFDSSSNFTDPQTLQLLQHSQRLLSNLSTIFHCLLSEAQELTQKGLVGLMNKNMVSSLISKYAQVVLWFCRTGLLPEGSDDDALQISRPFYTHSVISNYYTIRREELTRLAKGKWCADCLMIDGLVGQCGERLTNLWKRDEGGTGKYPPPTLHALLDIYLLENIDEAAKNAIVIYLLLDVMYSFPNKEGASVESFPPAFAIPIGLVKLVQGLWLLDHRDHQSSFELLLHPAASHCQFEWQHERVLQALMCQSQHSVALRYFHVTKPPISSTSRAKLCLSVLLHNRCLVEALSLLRQHSNRLNVEELLGFVYESCQGLGLIKELLKLPLGLTEQESLEKFLQGTGGIQNRELLMVHYLQQAKYIPALQLNHSLKMNLVNERDPKLKERYNTRNSILDLYGKVLPKVQRKLAIERAKPYQHPYAVHREVCRPQPLSTVTKRSASEKVMSRAGYVNSVLTKIEEVWLGKGATPLSSPARSSWSADAEGPTPSSMVLSDPFLGTPITKSAKRRSRLMDLVVYPYSQTPQPLLSPPRPPSSWVSPKSVSKAPELSLLQTPLVVKRARALAASGPVFSAFTPQSILRSSLRPTPVATPSASPGRSITPPLRSKESRITFIEEEESPEPEKGIRWTNGMAAESEISLLTRGSMRSKTSHKTWSSQPAEEEEEEEEEGEEPCVKFLPPEGGIPSSQLACFESKLSSIHEAPAGTRPSDATRAQLSLSFETSELSVRSTDTTLEFYDAPLPDTSGAQDVKEGHTEMEDQVVTVNTHGLAESQEPTESTSAPTEQTPLLLPASDDIKSGEEKLKEEETIEIRLEEQNKNDDHVESEEPDELESIEDAAALPQLQISIPHQVCNQVTENTDYQTGPEVRSPHFRVTEATESTKFTEYLEISAAPEPTNEPEEDLDQSTDLTEFVQRHLFGNDLPLTRSGIHNTSQTQTSFNNESQVEVEEEVQAAVDAPTVSTNPISTASVTSSEPTGTDSHSVVSVNDSEELSSPVSEEEEEEEEESDQAEEEEEEEEDDDEEEEEEEDSGSEVEIIEEVQGNGRLPPLQPGSAFEQGHTHFLPSLSEPEAAQFSLISPGVEMKMVEEDMGQVVMVRLGADEEGMEACDDEEQGSSYLELKPSTTLLVPLELVDGQGGLLDSSQLGPPELEQAIGPDDSRSETPCGFSLMLDLDEDRDEEADTLPMENDLLPSSPPILSPAVEAVDDLVEKSEVSLLETDDQDPLYGEVPEEDQRKAMDAVDGMTESELAKLADLQTDNTEAIHEAESAKEQSDAEFVTLVEVHEPAGLSVSGPTLLGEVPAVMLAEDQEPEGLSLPEPVGEASAVFLADDCEPPCFLATEMLAEDHEPVGLSLSPPSPVGELPAEVLADTQEPEVLLVSGPSSMGELHAAVDEKDTAEEADKSPPPPAVDQEGPEENGTVDRDTDKAPSRETATAGEDKEQDSKASAGTGDEMKMENKTRRTTRRRQSKDTDVEEERPVMEVSQTEGPPVPETPTSRSKKKAPPTPTRRTTRQRTVTFISPLVEESEEDGTNEEVGTSVLPLASPSRTPRKPKQNKDTNVQASTPRRSARNAQLLLPRDKDDGVGNDTAVVSTSKTSSPARRQASQRASTRTSQRTQSEGDEEPEGELRDTKGSRRTSSKTPTPAKRRTTQGSPSRRSSRRPLSTSEEEPGQDFVSSVKLDFKKSRTEPSVLEEEEADEGERKKPASPSRATRQSNRITLNVYPQVKLVPVLLPQSARKMRGETTVENIKEPELNSSNSLRPTRSKLWDHLEEEHPLLDSPLEVDSETPVADALIKRLQDEEAKDEGGIVVTKMLRTSKRSTKSSVGEVHSLLPLNDGLGPEPEESSPGEHSFIYSPSRRKTRANRAESPCPSEESTAPVTRSRGRVGKDASVAPHEIASEEDLVEVEKAQGVAKTSKAGKRAAKSKAFFQPPPVAEVDLISPLPSPAQPIPRVLKRIMEGEAPTSSMNLRRKRVMDSVLKKPVTRRKKL